MLDLLNPEGILGQLSGVLMHGEVVKPGWRSRALLAKSDTRIA